MPNERPMINTNEGWIMDAPSTKTFDEGHGKSHLPNRERINPFSLDPSDEGSFAENLNEGKFPHYNYDAAPDNLPAAKSGEFLVERPVDTNNPSSPEDYAARYAEAIARYEAYVDEKTEIIKGLRERETRLVEDIARSLDDASKREILTAHIRATLGGTRGVHNLDDFDLTAEPFGDYQSDRNRPAFNRRGKAKTNPWYENRRTAQRAQSELEGR